MRVQDQRAHKRARRQGHHAPLKLVPTSTLQKQSLMKGPLAKCGTPLLSRQARPHPTPPPHPTTQGACLWLGTRASLGKHTADNGEVRSSNLLYPTRIFIRLHTSPLTTQGACSHHRPRARSPQRTSQARRPQWGHWQSAPQCPKQDPARVQMQHVQVCVCVCVRVCGCVHVRAVVCARMCVRAAHYPDPRVCGYSSHYVCVCTFART